MSKYIPFLTRMMQNWNKNITTINDDDKNMQKKILKNTINGYVYVEKYHNLNYV